MNRSESTSESLGAKTTTTSSTAGLTRMSSLESSSGSTIAAEDPCSTVPTPKTCWFLDIPNMPVAAPPAELTTDLARKQWIWDHYQDELFQAMSIHQMEEAGDEQGETGRGDLDAAKQSLRLLDQIADVQRQFLQKEEPRTVFGYLLTGLLDLMDSEYGFIGEVKYEEDGTMYLHNHAISNIAWNTATREFYEANVEAGLKFYNMETLFGHVMVHAEPVLANCPATDPRSGSGIPDGHPPLNHFLGIPFFEPGCGKTKLSGMVGIANKPGGYSQRDIEFLDPFVVTCSSLIQAYGAMQENMRLIDNLEEKVRERTFEIQLANERLRQANEKVVQASEAQLKHFACMSHEIRTPLNCITGLSSLLLETEMTPQQMDSMKMIVTSSELLSAVVNDILDYSKLATGKVEIDIKPSHLHAVLDAVVHSIEVKGADRNLRLVTTYDPYIPRLVDTDGRRLQQILYNLLGNAIKFSREGGIVELMVSIEEPHNKRHPQKVRVSTETNQGANASHSGDESSEAPESSAPISRCPFYRKQQSTSSAPPPIVVESTGCPMMATSEASCSNNSKCPIRSGKPISKPQRILRFVVKDYGTGIDKKDFGKIFQPFMQASAETEKLYGGTGLGLAITSKLVESLGGTITVDSELGQWSTFTVDFPFYGELADIENYSQSLSSTRLVVVNHEKAEGLPTCITETYKMDVVELASSAELAMLAKVKWAIDPKCSYLCLIHEELYEPAAFETFEEAAPGSILLTFGRQYSSNAPRSRAHYRSLSNILPSNFVWSLLSCKNANVRNTVGASSFQQKGFNESLRVLIAEDNQINQKVLTRLLKRNGVDNITVVDNGQKAVEHVEAFDYDLVLMDMQMPVLGGLDATRIIVNNTQHAPHKPRVVFVTANALSSFEKVARDAGAVGFIPKPFNMEKIQAFLTMMANGEI